MSDDATPIRQQYLEIKRQHPNTILFFRLGDFYETFDQDAEITARELDIVLTSKPVGKGQRVPLAGIPYHAVENYLARMIEKGYHVAICEQVGEQPVKGLFPREVVRVVTPGTVIEPGLLKGDRNNYLAAIAVYESRAGIAYVDISTGEFAATEIESADLPAALRAELIRLNPAEVLVPDNFALAEAMGLNGNLTRWTAWRFESGRCQETVLSHFQISALDGFGLRGMGQAVRAAGVIIQYLQETQPAALKLLTGIATYSLDEFMVLDAATRRNLELTETIRGGIVDGSLLSVLDYTVTPMGKRLIRQWVSKPLLDLDEIWQRQTAVQALLDDGLLRAELRASLHLLGDLEPAFYKDSLTTRDLTGDSVPEIIFNDWEWLSVFSCSNGKYIQIFDRTGFLVLQIVDTGIQDLNGDGLPEMYFRLLDHIPINGAYYLYVYEWNGSQFQNLIILNIEDYTEHDYPGAYYHGTATDFSFPKNIKKGTFDIVIRGEVSCLPCETAGPWRKFTDVFTWNGSGFQHLPRRLDPPVYRFQAVQDGDLEMWRGNHALAMQFYQQALEDKNLKGWSIELFQQQNDILRAEVASMPTPTPLSSDPNEFTVLSSYIHYRIMLLQAVQGNPESVRSQYEAFRQAGLPGQPGYDYLALATIFWNAYNNTHDLSASCLAIRQYAKDHYDAIFTPINDTWHGWQSPGHMDNPSDEQLICPFK